MNKRIALFLVSVFLIVVMIAGSILFSNKRQIKDDKNFTEAQAAKSIALLFFDENECESEEKDYFNELAGGKWYEKYVNILLDKKSDLTLFEPSHEQMQSRFTYSEAESVLKALGMTKDKIESWKNNKREDDAVTSERWYEIYEELVMMKLSDVAPEKCEITIAASYNDSEKLEPYSVVTDKGIIKSDGINMEKFKDTRVNAFVRGNQIVVVGKTAEDTVLYKNVWIANTKGEKITVYIGDIKRKMNVKGLKEHVKNALGDITIEHGKVTMLSIKKDRINGKVLEINDSTVEIEGFGRLNLDEQFKVYKNIDGVSETDRNSILVGYDSQTFIVADGKVCAAVIDKQIVADNIRVLITTTGFKSRYHDQVSVTCSGDFQITYGDKIEKIIGGTVMPIDKSSPYLADGRIKFEPLNENDKIQILSIERGYGNPGYRGSIEVASDAEGLLVVNELSLEKYLYAVVPSEMPVSYGEEALKAQAVCARSYAYKHLMANSCSEYGAHVDDSTSFQVYNNTEECEESVSAVDATYGEIMTYEGEVISAYFFSTSCGSTTTSAIWGAGELPYIKARMVSNDENKPDLKDEAVFSSFIRSSYDSFDSSFPWYRWNVTMPMGSICSAIDENLQKLYAASPESVLVLNKDGNYVSTPVSSVGTLQKLQMGGRLDGGVLNEIIFIGTDATVKVIGELNIRKILSPYGCNVNKKDGSVNSTMSMLPSAYFVADEIVSEGKITGYTFVGGGYGHGAGMSQNAAKIMGETMSFKEILKFFYNGVKIETIYNN